MLDMDFCAGEEQKKKIINENNVSINRALRCIHFNKHNDSLGELKSQKKILDVKSLYIFEVGLFMFNNNLLSPSFEKLYKS